MRDTTPATPAAPARRPWQGLFVPLGARLVGLFLVLALGVTVTFLVGLHRVQHEGWRGYMHPLVTNYADMLVAEIGMPPDIERARAITLRLPLHIRIEGPRVNWDSEDEAEGEHEEDAPRPPPPPPPRGAAVPPEVVALPNGGSPIPLILPGPRQPAPGPGLPRHLLPRAPELDPGGLHLVRRLPDGHRIWIGLAEMPAAERAQHVGWMTLGAILALTALAYIAVRRMLAPLAALRAGAIRYGQGDFSQPVEVVRRDELGDLAVEMNGMAARLHRMLDAKRQLLLAISHELRSPLARARLNAELVEDSAERTALLRDLGEMRDLISDLLESERLADGSAGGHAALQTERTGLAELVTAQCGQAAAAGTLELDLAGGLPELLLDRSRVRLVLRNLVDNALRHAAGAPRAPQVRLRLAPDGRAVLLQVRDFGPGMEPAQLAHASEAFYRADAARQRSTGGVGLGLYLCRLIAEAHGGRFELRNAGPGLEAQVSFPVPTAGA